MKPRHSQDEFVKVATAQNQAEAELVEGILRDADIPMSPDAAFAERMATHGPGR